MAATNPYIRKIGNIDGEALPTYRLIDDFGFYVEELPFVLSTEVKDVDSNSYYDEDGDVEWVQRRLRVKAYEMKIKFISKGTKEVLYGRYKKLRNYMLGLDNTGTSFMLYDEWHGIGRKDIRLSKFDDSAEYDEMNDGTFVLAIEVTLKVNDPLTDVYVDDNGNLYAEDGSGLVINGEEVVPYENCYVTDNTLYIV